MFSRIKAMIQSTQHCFTFHSIHIAPWTHTPAPTAGHPPRAPSAQAAQDTEITSDICSDKSLSCLNRRSICEIYCLSSRRYQLYNETPMQSKIRRDRATSLPPSATRGATRAGAVRWRRPARPSGQDQAPPATLNAAHRRQDRQCRSDTTAAARRCRTSPARSTIIRPDRASCRFISQLETNTTITRCLFSYILLIASNITRSRRYRSTRMTIGLHRPKGETAARPRSGAQPTQQVERSLLGPPMAQVRSVPCP